MVVHSAIRAVNDLSRPDPVSSALELSVVRNGGLIRHVGRSRGLSESDLDELVQDVRIRLWRALSTAGAIESARPAYVYRTAVSASLDLLRRRRAGREEARGLEPDGRARAFSTEPDLAAEASELVQQVAQVLMELTLARRQVVRMHLVGYHARDSAELLGWTETKTKNLLYRGLRELRTRLGERGIGVSASS